MEGAIVSCLDIYPASHMERPRFRLRAKPAPAMLSEVFAETPMDGAVTGFVLAQLGPGGKPVLWVQDRMSRREAGGPCLAGIRPGIDLLKVAAPNARDALWTAEQGLACSSLGVVIAEIWGDPPALDFTASKRLALRSEARGVPCWLLRRFAQPQSQRRARALACRSAPLGPACFRPSRTGLTALAGGTVPVAFAAAWRLDRPL